VPTTKEPPFRSSRMSRVRFHAGDIDLELSGSESFILRQLKLLASCLGRVDPSALGDPDAPAALPEPPADTALALAPPGAAPATPAPADPAPQVELAPAPPAAPNGGPLPAPPRSANGDASDELLRFYQGFRPLDLDRQSDAALLFAYYLQQREGHSTLQIGDLIRCCIRAGVDTRNFNRTLGTLTRRGFLETARQGGGYRLSEQGVAAVENRM